MKIFVQEPTETAHFLPTALGFNPVTPIRKKSSLSVNNTVRYVSIDIQEDVLYRLIHQGELAVEHLRGLDEQTQQAIKIFLLESVRVRQ